MLEIKHLPGIEVRKGYDGIAAGHYHLTGTVHSDRANLFYMEPGKERHIGTLVSGSKSKIAQFDLDCERIVGALAMHDANAELLVALKDVTVQLSQCSCHRKLTTDEQIALDAARAAIAKAEGRNP